MERPLNVSVTATFTPVANSPTDTIARAQIGPQTFGEKWHITRIVTNTTSTGLNGQSQLRVYRAIESPLTLLDGTYSADQDISDTDISLVTLENLVFVWTNGDNGSEAIGIISGTIDDGRG